MGRYVMNYDSFMLEESFTSSKLRTIIQQHGKPKREYERMYIHDLNDSDILGVSDNWDSFVSDFRDNDNYNACAIKLEDGSYLVLNNGKSSVDLMMRIKDKIASRHVGRDRGVIKDIHAEHMENVDELEKSRLEKLLTDSINSNGSVLNEIRKYINDYLYDEFNEELWEDSDISNSDNPGEIVISGKKYELYFESDVNYFEDKSYGSSTLHYTCEPSYIAVMDTDAEIEVELGDLEINGIDELYSKIKIDVDGGVYDPYEAYGVNPGDFA